MTSNQMCRDVRGEPLDLLLAARAQAATCDVERPCGRAEPHGVDEVHAAREADRDACGHRVARPAVVERGHGWGADLVDVARAHTVTFDPSARAMLATHRPWPARCTWT